MNLTEIKRNKPELIQNRDRNYFLAITNVRPVKVEMSNQCNLPKPVETKHLSLQFMLGETFERGCHLINVDVQALNTKYK